MKFTKIEKEKYFKEDFLKEKQIAIIEGVLYFIAIAHSYNYQEYEGDGKLKSITYFLIGIDKEQNQYFMSDIEYITYVEARKFYRSLFNAKNPFRVNGNQGEAK